MQKFINSIKIAISGVKKSVVGQTNIKIQVCAAVLVVFSGIIFGISLSEWVTLLLTIGVVLSIELLNTAIETTVDLFSPQIHPLAEKAKDISAGAVLVISTFAFLIGLIIFLPRIFPLIEKFICQFL